MQSVSYHQTTPMSKEQLDHAIAAAESQDEAVVLVFNSYTTNHLAPSYVHHIGHVAGRKWLLTSVRRAMSNLSFGDTPLLVKTKVMVSSPYGRPEHTWMLKSRVEA